MNAPFILLVNPWIYDFAAYDLWTRPVGLLSIASILQSAGCAVHLLDCLDSHHPGLRSLSERSRQKYRNFGQGPYCKQRIEKPACLGGIPRNYSRYGLPPDLVRGELENLPRPDAVLVGSMMTYWYPAVTDCVALVKAVFPGTPVLLGGIYATLCPEHASRNSGADHIVRGPFDAEAMQLLEKVSGKRLAAFQEPPVPRPACELLSSKKVIPLLTSRGCPLRCPYCASRLLQPGFLQRSPREVILEIEHWHVSCGATDFAFYDDALLINPGEHILPLLKMIVERRFRVRFHAPNGLHVAGIDAGLAELMYRAGFKTLRLGLETADPALQRETGNKASRADFGSAARALRSAGFTRDEVGAYILAGLPGQSSASVRGSISFVQEHGIRPCLTEYSPIPGTAFWERAVAASPFPLQDEPLFHNNTLLPCRSDDFTIEDMETLKRESRK